MGASVGSDTTPVREVAAQLHAAADQLRELAEADTEAGRVILAHTDPPRLTGAMGAGQRVVAMPGGVGLVSTVGYWTFVHWGAPRAGVRARPWIAQATDRSTDEVLEVYAAHARSALDTVKG